MNAKKFTGIMPAIFSVYDENMNVLENTVAKMVDFQLEGGSTGFYVGGNTGECTVLPAKTRKQMLEAVSAANAGRGDVIAHIGAGHLDETLELLEHANAVGVDAVASLPPSLSSYYNMEETIRYYQMLAERSAAPVIAYITGVLSGDPVEFAERVAEIPNVSGIKLTIPNYYAFGRVVTAGGGKLNILNGPDETMICGLAEGADGAIGTTYNFLPRLACGIYNDFMAGNIAGAREKQQKLTSMIPLALGRGIGYWKAIMTTMGFDMGYTVAPSAPVTAEQVEDLRRKLDAIGFYGWV